MPRFFTHVRNGTGLAEDGEGQEFADLAEARRHALQSAAEIVAEDIRTGHVHVDLEVHIDDEAGNRLATLPVSASVTGLG